MCSYYRPEWPEVKLWVPAEGQPIPADLAECFTDPETTLIAFNANFERNITRCCLPQFDVPIFRWRCAMVSAMSIGFPGKLEQAGPAIGLPEELFKQEGGRKLINKFCKPRKPSKKNPDTRWTRHTAPEEWALFKQYCIQDVVAETAIWDKLHAWRMPAEEQRLWEIDQALNDRGVQVDVELALAAHTMGLMHRARLVEKAQALTSLANPNSVQQLMAWLNDQPDFDPEEETDVEDLRKKTVEKILGRDDLGDVVRKVLELRQQIAKSSLKKYDTILRATCSDGRIRGTMQFGGANRTMRWAGRLLQVQNLPQGMIEDLELLSIARDLVRLGEYEALCILFGEDQIPNVLATLIRTCLIAGPGKRLIVADLSAIEARVIAWFAKCEWRLEVFRTHGKIYEASAAAAFGIPLEEILAYKKATGKHHPLRKKGKVIELACLAADTKVLTPRGYVSLTDVTTDDHVWDGKQWTEHKGLIYRGEKETINLLGVKVTPDHLISTGGSWVPAQALVSNESIRCQALETGSESLPYSVPLVRNKAPARMTSFWSSVPAEGRLTRLVSAIYTKAGALVAKHVPGRKQPQRLNTFSSMRIPVRTMHTVGAYLIGSRPAIHDATPQTLGNTRITGAAVSTSSSPGGRIKDPFWPTWSALKAGIGLNSSLTESTSIKGTNREIYGSSPNPQTQRTNESSSTSKQKLPVFDLLFCGPRNAFTILSRKGPLLVHNCGYQGAANAMITMGALEQGLQLEELQPMVDAWRLASPEIAGKIPPGEKWAQGGLWRDVENAAKKCIRTKSRQEVAGCIFRMAGGNMVITLPSGRHMHYVRAHLARKDGKQQIAYWGTDQKTKRWGLLYTYGGKLCIAKDTPVLTRRGWVPIQNVVPFEEVWDGVEWVRQGGVAVNGEKETIKAHGVRMTPDHEILTEKGWRHASQSEGHNRAPCRLPDGYEVHRVGRQEIDLGSNLRLRDGRLVTGNGVAKAIEARGDFLVWLHAQGLHQGPADAARDVFAPRLRSLAEHARPVLSSDPPSVGELRWPRDNSLRSVESLLPGVLGGHGADLRARLDYRPGGQRAGLFPRELPLGNVQAASQQSPQLSACTGTAGADHRSRSGAPPRDLAFDFALQSEEVFDLINCGPRHRFVVADENGQPLIVHNCENIVQAFSRDILREILFELDDLGYHPIMLVHDEGVLEEDIGHGSLNEVLGAMGHEVSYAPGLPLKGAGFENHFYYKD